VKEESREQKREAFHLIRTQCSQAEPEEGDFPEWNGDRIESLPEFFNGTAHLWDDVIGAPGGRPSSSVDATHTKQLTDTATPTWGEGSGARPTGT
jgi:hypothetical protein